MNYKYKMTEIGELPDAWEVSSIGKHLQFKNGLNKEKSAFGYGTPIINYTDVYNNRGLYKKDVQGLVNLSKGEIERFNVKEGDILFTRTSETKEEVGLSSVLLENIENCVFSGFLLRGRPIDDLLYKDFCKYCFSNKFIRKNIVDESSITTRALTNGKSLSKIKFPLPPKDEQKEIAECLTAIDNEIKTLEKIIEKKTYIKDAIAKKLLSGEYRLPGYKEEWRTIKLDKNTCNITTGYRDVNEGSDKGIYPFFTCSKEEFKSNAYSFDAEAILVAGNGDVGTLHYYNGKFEAYQRTYVLTDFKYNIKYLYFYMNYFFMSYLKGKQLGTTINYIILGQLINFEIKLPADVNELNEIVNLLEANNKEIKSYKTKLQKEINIKNTILNDLITGHKRLI